MSQLRANRAGPGGCAAAGGLRGRLHQGGATRPRSLGTKVVRGRIVPGGESLLYLMFNRNQRSMTVNLKHPTGRAISYQLVDRADVMVENFRAGVMDGLGLGYATLSTRNPRLIYCSSSGYRASHPTRGGIGGSPVRGAGPQGEVRGSWVRVGDHGAIPQAGAHGGRACVSHES
jgi:hypothetical protein